jgi:hypothetical protein
VQRGHAGDVAGDVAHLRSDATDVAVSGRWRVGTSFSFVVDSCRRGEVGR